MTKSILIVAIAAVVVAAMATPLVSSQTAAAAQTTAASKSAAGGAQRTCGWVGGETYRHCSTRTWVLIDADNIWTTTFRNICVGPGDTHLGYLSRWRITYAWYIGKRC